MNRKILFMTRYRKYVPMFRNDVCEAKCREYGFTFDLPSRDGGLENPDWRTMLPHYDAVRPAAGNIYQAVVSGVHSHSEIIPFHLIERESVRKPGRQSSRPGK